MPIIAALIKIHATMEYWTRSLFTTIPHHRRNCLIRFFAACHWVISSLPSPTPTTRPEFPVYSKSELLPSLRVFGAGTSDTSSSNPEALKTLSLSVSSLIRFMSLLTFLGICLWECSDILSSAEVSSIMDLMSISAESGELSWPAMSMKRQRELNLTCLEMGAIFFFKKGRCCCRLFSMAIDKRNPKRRRGVCWLKYFKRHTITNTHAQVQGLYWSLLLHKQSTVLPYIIIN